MEVFNGDGLGVVGRVSGNGLTQTLRPLATLERVDVELRLAEKCRDLESAVEYVVRARAALADIRGDREAQA
jgi:hypothetical protein